jgi:acid phosphatase
VDARLCEQRLPEQIRVAIRDPISVTISWKTYGYPNGSNDTPYPQVQYNTDGNFSHGYSNTSIGNSSIYDKLYNISWFHNCVLNVQYSQKYYYRIPASDPCVNQSGTYSFTAQPNTGNTTPINITIFGDIGYDTSANNNASTKTITALKQVASTTNFFLHVGDIGYGDEKDSAPDIVKWYESKWDTFQQRMQPVSANNFYMTLPGNHEVTCSQLGGDSECVNPPYDKRFINITSQYRNFSAYMNRFYMPGGNGLSNSSYRNLWYSFDYGLAHIVVINTETDFPEAPSGPNKDLNGGNFAPNGTQINWLIADLTAANNNRRNVPWIIVAGHRPFFGTVPTPPITNNCDPCIKAFAKIIFEKRVDFYFCGHVHWYERLYPVNINGTTSIHERNYINQTGPIYITTGAGGAPEVAQVHLGPKPIQSAYLESSYGYSQLQIKDATHCRLIFYNSDRRNITDSVEIIRRRTV